VIPTRIPYHIPKTPKPRLTETEQERKKFYNSAAWRRCRSAYIVTQPLCEMCMARDPAQLTVAVLVHHIIERLDPKGAELWYDFENLMSLCSECHSTEHARRNQKENRQ
jgi:5-methylcytosine-specific restriction enzyme A